MKHDAESEAMQNAAIVKLAHAVATCAAHHGDARATAEAHDVVRMLTPEPEALAATARDAHEEIADAAAEASK